MCQLFIGICAAIYQRHILLDCTGEYLKIGESAILVCNCLKDHCNRRTIWRTVDFNEVTLFIFTDLCRRLIWRRHVVFNSLKQCIRPDACYSRAAKYGSNDQVAHTLTDTCNQFFIWELLTRKVAFHQILRQFGYVFAQCSAVLIDALYHIIWNRNLYALIAFHLVCLAEYTVYDTNGISIAFKDWHNDWTNWNTELLL